ncbi:LysR family transcriptional regulator [Mesobacillus campisalis]|uniref:LysR family transcriptional regulator n=1 Tax=Mesobacillus campisalis TaxID=1408103 RepID=A0A0M2ST28_9BACI|nr:selenium metabolism-associated LysR family transcriptional regulator [Mesobacillus campisalis]KKK36137.1 LysR family transcriptional regulator [Mesobacillus campisalis]
MDLHQLYVFTKVVENKSFSKAAEEVFLSQSTVSAHIQALEKMLNMKLFDRVGRESVLTPHGERLYHWAQQLLLLKDRALLDLSESMTELRGVIRMAASSVPGQFLLPKMINGFRRVYPSVTFHISEASSKIVAEKVLSGTVDVGILGEKYENERVEYIPLLKEHLVLIAANHFKFPQTVSIHELLEFPFVMRSPDSGTNALLERLLKKKHIPKDQLNIIAYTDSGQSLIQFVKHGIGISIISEIAAEEYCQTNVIKKFEIEDFAEERYFYLAYNKNKTLSLVAKLFINDARKLIEAHE